MIDTHCHLDYLEQLGDEPALLSALVTIGASVEHAQAGIALAEQYPNVWTTVGLHPTDASQDSPETRASLEALALHPKVVGIGESGLDYYWDTSTKTMQWAAFEWQLDLARRRAQPIVIHTRDRQGHEQASLDCADMLRSAAWTQGILHCCNGHLGLIETALALGFYVSFAGNVTYKNAKEIQAAACMVPIDRILFETDAPFLAPMPYRGQKNRPSYVRHTMEAVAALRGISAAELEQHSDWNAKQVYHLPL